VGANATITFLLMNNWEPDFDEEELIDLVLSVASGRLAKPALAAIFEARCRSLEAGWHRAASRLIPVPCRP